MTRPAHPLRARVALLICGLLPSCGLLPPIDFQRMIYQDRFTTWQPCAYFPDGRELQAPPDGTLPRDAPAGDAALTRGVVNGAYVEEIPLSLTREQLVAGQARFEIYCAVCHGLLGDGVSVVASNMHLRRPPAIAGEAARALPAGRVYQVIDEGYGFMRSYAEDLGTPEERWTVVAYLRALQQSRRARLDALPPDVRQEAERQLR